MPPENTGWFVGTHGSFLLSPLNVRHYVLHEGKEIIKVFVEDSVEFFKKGFVPVSSHAEHALREILWEHSPSESLAIMAR